MAGTLSAALLQNGAPFTMRRVHAMTAQFDQVSVLKKANVYFDGKCVSHTVLLADGTRKSVGVILPSTLTFNTGAPEVMELIEGRCRVKLAGQASAKDYVGGQSFEVPANSSFEIQTLEAVHYVCHFG
jgi:purine/pyrimidine-nucleoside phosphorylase